MSFTPDRQRKSTSVTASPSPSPFAAQTPRSERRRLDTRWTDGNRPDRDRGEVNVQVLVRCRPLLDDEQRLNVPKVISCNEQRREVTVLQNIANKQIDRSFSFDKVFGPKAQQRSIYDQAVSPIVNEVLEGFNCTVFAYGQTGTGKTYTMEGGIKNKGGELPVDAGVIPRAVRHIFDALEAQSADYSMKVTFLELYNEEITDLLAPDDCTKFGEDNKQRKPISLMEDGKGGVVVRGLEEEVVYSANEIFSLLERGSAKRRTVETLLNKHSSRSHSIFSITIHVKETEIGNEELIKCGKLNLVDLAGSENISRSGAREGRAREAGEINKSLLTLGRVINALVEHSAHIPYRDSKLTRLLRDSLGGKTKTCIIATVSPSAHCLDETLSTLDYAFRAKNIKNKPEVANQRMSKSVLLKDLYLEIEKMKQDVRAAREKNGVYIPNERFAQDEAEKKAMSEKIEQLEFDMDLKGKTNLKNTNKALEDLQDTHQRTISTLEEKELIISKLLQTENSILERTKELSTDLRAASEDITALFTKIDSKSRMETENQALVLTFGSQLEQRLKGLHRAVISSVSQQHQQLRCMEEYVSSFIASKCENTFHELQLLGDAQDTRSHLCQIQAMGIYMKLKATKLLEQKIEQMKDAHASGIHNMKELAVAMERQASSNMEELKLTVATQAMAVENFLVTAISEAEQVLHDINHSLAAQKQLLALSALQQEEGLQRTLVSTQSISKATVDFFSDLYDRASKLSSILEEKQREKSHKLKDFEKTFQEASEKEEKLALEKIAAILANLTSAKTNMVSEALVNVKTKSIQEKQMLQQELSEMQHVSTTGRKEWNMYIEKVESQFQEDTYSASDYRAKMENALTTCSTKVDHSRKQWENLQLSIDNLDKTSITEIESTAERGICENHSACEELASVCSSTNVDFETRVSELLNTAKQSLHLDQDAMEKIENLSTACSDQLKVMQDGHMEGVTEMRNQADQCLRKEYLVDHPTDTTPKRRALKVPSLASIEEMRTPSFDLLVKTVRSPTRSSKDANMELKQQQAYLLSPRSPLTAVN
ncbi:hypothetical protein ACLOJK_001689 [Asimina triloba]